MSDLFFFKEDYLVRKPKQKAWKPKEDRFQDAFSFTYTDALVVECPEYELGPLVGTTAKYDVECYPNFFYIAFLLENGKYITFTQDEHNKLNIPKLEWVLNNFCLVGYYSKLYDMLMVMYSLQNVTCAALHKASLEIIGGMRTYAFEKKYKLKAAPRNHIDLIEVAPLRGALKLYAGRLHTRRMQDLPFDPLKALNTDQKLQLTIYCCNDLVNTELLFKELEPQLLLRLQMSKQYQVDLRSKSDAQVAEAVITSELNKLNGTLGKRPEISPGEAYRYRVPSFVGYRTPVLQNMLDVVRNAEFVVDGEGYIDMPESIATLKLNVGGCTYAMGIGGLHSTEKTVAHYADENTLLLDRDVVSYYPSIILNQKLYPRHLGTSFLTVYKSIVDRRITAKDRAAEIEDSLKPLSKIAQPSMVEKALIKNLSEERKTCKTQADSLKITINGSFGKLGSKWSVLYAPDLMLQVTITGQLCLLMLIEMIEDLGIPVISANTDGVLIKCPKSRYSELEERIKWWEQITSFKTEETRYRAIYSRDVNNYIAHKDKPGDPSARFLDQKLGFKTKGKYCERGSAGDSVLSKNPEYLICMDAVLAMLANGTPIEQTVRECRDMTRFAVVRNVQSPGGAQKSGVHLGKVIRWYYSTEMKGEINRATKGDKIPDSDGARPMMELPAVFPSDVDYQRYIDGAMNILYKIGHTPEPPKTVELALFEEPQVVRRGVFFEESQVA
jgi:hypothetical protein